jgi:hypothetical protein
MAEIALAAEIAVLEMIPDRMRNLANVEELLLDHLRQR